ncbi:MAG: helix-turn-helix domain-containing protein, partial [Acidobacteriaceae bacterium]|nr:helix-turn-helix domain-containing protein [Acidobacteriaceae bacterium]
LADAAGISLYHFAKLFKNNTGSSPHQYVLQRRLERAKELLQRSKMSLSEVSLENEGSILSRRFEQSDIRSPCLVLAVSGTIRSYRRPVLRRRSKLPNSYRRRDR